MGDGVLAESRHRWSRGSDVAAQGGVVAPHGAGRNMSWPPMGHGCLGQIDTELAAVTNLRGATCVCGRWGRLHHASRSPRSYQNWTPTPPFAA